MGKFGEILKKLGQDTKSGVKKMGETYSVNSQISDARKELEKSFAALGRAVYTKAQNGEAPEGFEEEFGTIRLAAEKLENLSERLNKIKGVVYCPECGKEASRGEKFCSYCGAKLPDDAADAGDAAEKIVSDVKEAAGQASEAVNDAVDKASAFFGSVAGKADSFVKGLKGQAEDGEEEVEEDEEESFTEVEENAEEAAPEAEEAAQEAAPEAEEAADEAEPEDKGEA